MGCALPVVAAEAALLLALVALRAGSSLTRCLCVPASDSWPGRVSPALPVRMLKGERSARGGHRQAGGFENRLQFAGADHGVHFGNALPDFVAVALHQAAGDDELFGRAGGLVARHLENGVDRLLLGGVDEAAGVDDEDFGLFGMGGQARAGAVEQAHHDLGVDEVFGAA